MEDYSQTIIATWRDIDANGHLRNTAFSEFCTHTRFQFFAERGFTPRALRESGKGPIILREHSEYLREVGLLEKLRVTMVLYRASPNFARFDFRQVVWKENGKQAARLTVDCLWIDLSTRKPCVPPEPLLHLCEEIPRTPDFYWIEGKSLRQLAVF